MSGKEALNNLIEELKWCCNDGVELTDYDKSMIEPIQRDLEILDILKKSVDVKELKYKIVDAYVNRKIEIEELKVMVGWLENEI